MRSERRRSNLRTRVSRAMTMRSSGCHRKRCAMSMGSMHRRIRGADVQAQAWLDQVQAANPAGFDHMPLFQATRTDYNDPTKYAGTKLTNPDIYTVANRPAIPGTLSPKSPSLSAIGTGNLKGFGNLASDLFNRALDLSVGDAGTVAQFLGLKDPGASGQTPKFTLTPDENAAAQATGYMAAPFGLAGEASTAVDVGAARSTTSALGTADALLPDADFVGRGTVRSDLADHLVNPMPSGKQLSGGARRG